MLLGIVQNEPDNKFSSRQRESVSWTSLDIAVTPCSETIRTQTFFRFLYLVSPMLWRNRNIVSQTGCPLWSKTYDALCRSFA